MKYTYVINSFYPSFSKKEKKIADFMLSEKENISYLSLSEISKRIDVSEATIVRFVKKIGFKGFLNFRIEVASEYSNIAENIAENYIENIEKNMIDTIRSSKVMLNKEDVEKALNLIQKAKRLYTFGLGASGVAAIELQNRFLRFGKIGHSVNDSHFQLMYASNTTKDDVIVVISISGETHDLIYPINIAKKNSCKIITITNHIKSTLAELSDVVLISSGKEALIDGGSLIAKISQLYIVDVLATGYALKNSKKSKEIRQKIAEVISKKNK